MPFVENEKEIGFINKAKDNEIYIHDFINRAGKFISSVSTDDATEIEISSKTKISLIYIKENKSVKGIQINKYVRKKSNLQYQQAPDQYVKLSNLNLQQLCNLVEIIKKLEIEKLSNNKISLIYNETAENDNETYNALRTFFERSEIRDKIAKGEIIPQDLLNAIELSNKRQSLDIFEISLLKNEVESFYQEWFKENSWIFGTDFVECLDERRIDIHNTTDFLMKAFDGFIDIIEIKRPDGNLKFWNDSQDHDNYIPHNDLIKAITQTLNYIYEIERKADSRDFSQDHHNLSVVKPRAILIYGRSIKWNEKQIKAFRILNASYHNLMILTYDHVLERARKMLGE